MKIVVMETGAFGVPSVRALYETEHEILALVTRPRVENPTRRELPEPEIVQLAQSHGTPVLRFASIKSPEAVASLRELDADLFFICDYGQILSRDGISAARLGGVNLHGSLLPKYRGSAPVQWALWNGDSQTGVTVIHITPEIDAGPIMSAAKMTIPDDWTAAELEPALSELGAPLVVRAVEQLARDASTVNSAAVQDASAACPAPKLRKTHSPIDWTRGAREIRNQIRALEPWPRTFTTWQKSESKPPIRLILLPIPEIIDCEIPDATPPGTVLSVGETLVVTTGCGALSIRKIQPAGKKPQTIPEFLCGNAVRPGDVLK